jgi:hypothetical protein
MISKDLEGNGHGIIEVLSQQLPGETGKTKTLNQAS